MEKNSSVLRRIGIVVCALLVLGCSGYLGWFLWKSQKNAQVYQGAVDKYVITPTETKPASAETAKETEPEETKPKYDLAEIDFKSLWKISENVIGWIQIPALNGVDYPVCWNGDNFYFLDHTWEGMESDYGAIFMEETNLVDFSEPYQVIYGHAMKDGSMFAGLSKYTKQKFYEENGGTIYLYLPKETRVYEVFSAAYVDCFDASVYSVGYIHNDEFGRIVHMMKHRAIYNTGLDVTQEDDIITLSTCAGGDNRIVVHAVLKDRVPVS